MIRNVLDNIKAFSKTNKKYGEYLFFIVFICYLITQYSLGTTLYSDYAYSSLPYRIFMIISVLVVFKIIFFNTTDELKNMIIYILIGIIIWIGCFNARAYDIFYYYLFIVAAKKIDFKKIVEIFVIVIIFSLLITVVASKFGFLLSLTNSRGWGDPGIRYALGTIYPTDLAARTFYLQLMYVSVRKFRLTFPEYIAGFSFSIMMYIITDTRVDFILMIATLLGALSYKYIVSFLEFLGTKILIVSGVIATFGMIILTYLYTSRVGALRILDKILSMRLKNGHEAFEKYNVTMAGQYIFQQGNGGVHNGMFHYFFIDCTFVRVLMMNGLITFMFFMGSLCYILNRFMKYKAYSLVIVLVLIVISSLIDHHMTEMSFNIIFLAMFANIDYFKDNSRSWI